MPVVVYRLTPAGRFYFKLPVLPKILICCGVSCISDIFPSINKQVSVLICYLSSQHCSTRTAYLTGFADLLFKCSHNILQIKTRTNMRLYTTHFIPALRPRAGCSSGKTRGLLVCMPVQPNSCNVKASEKSHAVSCQDLVILVWQGPSVGTRDKHKKCLQV